MTACEAHAQVKPAAPYLQAILTALHSIAVGDNLDHLYVVALVRGSHDHSFQALFRRDSWSQPALDAPAR